MSKKYYAVMELLGTDLNTNELTCYAYVVAQCNPIKTETVSVDGCTKDVHHVVFCWDGFGNTNIKPEYSENNVCINSSVVENVFDNIRECKKLADNLNETLIKNAISNSSMYEARDIAKKIRQKLQLAQTIQDKHLYEEDLQK